MGSRKSLTDDETRQVAEWFASLPRRRFNRVVEADMVPRTFVGQGRMRFIDPKQTGMEPFGNRIITLPENQELARRRDPRSGFVSYVPSGSIAQGKALVETGSGKSIACTICHGDGLKGVGNVPRTGRCPPDLHRATALSVQGGHQERSRCGADAEAHGAIERSRHHQHRGVRRVVESRIKASTFRMTCGHRYSCSMYASPWRPSRLVTSGLASR